MKEEVIEEVLYDDHALRVVLQVISGVHPYHPLAKLKIYHFLARFKCNRQLAWSIR